MEASLEELKEKKTNPKVLNPEMPILTVNNHWAMRMIMRNTLKLIGYENVIEAEDGILAREIIDRSKKIEFVISELNMSQMFGMDLLAWVRSNQEVNNIPFLIITTEADKDSVKELITKNMNYIVKPISVQKLKENIEKCLLKSEHNGSA